MILLVLVVFIFLVLFFLVVMTMSLLVLPFLAPPLGSRCWCWLTKGACNTLSDDRQGLHEYLSVF